MGTDLSKNIFGNVGDAMQLEFDDTKIDDYFDCEIVCDRSTASFKDQLSNDCGYITYKPGGYKNPCVTDLMVYVKYYVERQFKKSIDLLNAACSSQKRTQHIKTGKL